MTYLSVTVPFVIISLEGSKISKSDQKTEEKCMWYRPSGKMITQTPPKKKMERHLVGNVSNMSAHVAVMPTLSAENRAMPNVADAVTGFMAGSHVG